MHQPAFPHAEEQKLLFSDAVEEFCEDGFSTKGNIIGLRVVLQFNLFLLMKCMKRQSTCRYLVSRFI